MSCKIQSSDEAAQAAETCQDAIKNTYTRHDSDSPSLLNDARQQERYLDQCLAASTPRRFSTGEINQPVGDLWRPAGGKIAKNLLEMFEGNALSKRKRSASPEGTIYNPGRPLPKTPKLNHGNNNNIKTSDKSHPLTEGFLEQFNLVYNWLQKIQAGEPLRGNLEPNSNEYNNNNINNNKNNDNNNDNNNYNNSGNAGTTHPKGTIYNPEGGPSIYQTTGGPGAEQVNGPPIENNIYENYPINTRRGTMVLRNPAGFYFNKISGFMGMSDDPRPVLYTPPDVPSEGSRLPEEYTIYNASVYKPFKLTLRQVRKFEEDLAYIDRAFKNGAPLVTPRVVIPGFNEYSNVTGAEGVLRSLGEEQNRRLALLLAERLTILRGDLAAFSDKIGRRLGQVASAAIQGAAFAAVKEERLHGPTSPFLPGLHFPKNGHREPMRRLLVDPIKWPNDQQPNPQPVPDPSAPTPGQQRRPPPPGPPAETAPPGKEWVLVSKKKRRRGPARPGPQAPPPAANPPPQRAETRVSYAQAVRGQAPPSNGPSASWRGQNGGNARRPPSHPGPRANQQNIQQDRGGQGPPQRRPPFQQRPFQRPFQRRPFYQQQGGRTSRPPFYQRSWNSNRDWYPPPNHRNWY